VDFTITTPELKFSVHTGLELKPLDLLAHRRLRQVEPLRGVVETAAVGHGNEGTEQLEFQHAIDPIFRSIIL
jgi:hypothetical protein